MIFFSHWQRLQIFCNIYSKITRFHTHAILFRIALYALENRLKTWFSRVENARPSPLPMDITLQRLDRLCPNSNLACLCRNSSFAAKKILDVWTRSEFAFESYHTNNIQRIHYTRTLTEGKSIVFSYSKGHKMQWFGFQDVFNIVIVYKFSILFHYSSAMRKSKICFINKLSVAKFKKINIFQRNLLSKNWWTTNIDCCCIRCLLWCGCPIFGRSSIETLFQIATKRYETVKKKPSHH